MFPGDRGATGDEIRPQAYISAAEIRRVLQDAPSTMGPAELARRLGIDRAQLNALLTSVTFSCAELFETDKGALGLVGIHDDAEASADGAGHDPRGRDDRGGGETQSSTQRTSSPPSYRSKLTREFYTPKQVAQRWSVSLPTIRRMIKRGELQVLRLSATLVRVPVSEVERVEEERRR